MNNKLIPVKENIFQKIITIIQSVFGRRKINSNKIKKVDNLEHYEKSRENYTKENFLNSIKVESDNEKNNFGNDDGNTIIDKNSLLYKMKSIGYEFKEHSFIQDINPNEEKERFAQIYQDVKSGKISMSNLSPVDLIKMNYLLKKGIKNA